MSGEPDFNAHHRCSYCHGLKAKVDIMFCDDKPICNQGDCKDAYYRSTRPRPVERSYARFEHG